MTTNSYSPAPIYTISGIGPYDVPHDYTSSDELTISVVINDIAVALDPADYTVVPAGPATSGTVFLTAPAATSYDGETLTITRNSDVAQSWVSLSSTAVGLESQLDQMTRAIQETQVESSRSLRILDAPVAPYQPQDGRVPYWDSNLASFANGLDYSDLINGLAIGNAANDRVDAVAHAINGGLWRNDAAAVIADLDLTYTPDQTGTVAEAVKIITQVEGFTYAVAASNATDHHVTTAGGVKLYVLPASDGRVNVRAFGATGEAGVDQDTALVRAASVPYPVVFEVGVYEFTSELVLGSPWLGVYKARLGTESVGSPTDGVTLKFNGTGQAIRTNYSFEGITLEANTAVAGQSGLLIWATTFGTRYGMLRIEDFDGTGMAVGEKNVTASFFIDVYGVEIRNDNRQGAKGFYVSGLGLPNSNANRFQGVFVTGAFKQYFHIEGNNNYFNLCDANPINDDVTGGIDEVFNIEGNLNTFLNTYIEPFGGTMAPVLVRFGAEANSNRFLRTYLASIKDGSNPDAMTIDLGTNNDVEIGAVGFNLPQTTGKKDSLQNLCPNSYFQALKADGLPVGWRKIGTGTVARVTSTLRGAPYSMALTVAASAVTFQTHLATNGSSVYEQLVNQRAEKFADNTVTVGAWCWSDVQGLGSVMLNAGGSTVGNMVHSGSGEWEFLSAQIRAESGTPDVTLQLRTSSTNSPMTGTCYFSEPVVSLGGEVAKYADPRSLNDAEVVMAGRIVQNPAIDFADGDRTPDVSEGNVFVAANTATTLIFNFLGKPAGTGSQEITIIPTNANTTVQNSSYILPTGGTTRALAAYEVVKFVYLDSIAKWVEI